MQVDVQELPKALKAAAERSTVMHIMVVGGRHEKAGTVTLSSRLPSGAVEGPSCGITPWRLCSCINCAYRTLTAEPLRPDFKEVPLQQAFSKLSATAPLPPPALPPPRPGATAPPFHGASGVSTPQGGAPPGAPPGPAVLGGPPTAAGFGGPPGASASRGFSNGPPSQGQGGSNGPPSQGQGLLGSLSGDAQNTLQSLIRQIQQNGGMEALSNEGTRAQVLQALQSNPQLVQLLQQQRQQQQ